MRVLSFKTIKFMPKNACHRLRILVVFSITEQSLVSTSIMLPTNKSQKLNTFLTKNKVKEVYCNCLL